MRRSHCAFTLIELAVVIAVVAILAVTLWPVRSCGPEDARRSSCQSNLKQIGLGFMQYIQDSDDRLPPVAVVQSGYWAGLLQPYVGGWEIFHCPMLDIERPRTTDYYFNARLAKVDATKLVAPALTVFMGEGRDNSPPFYAIGSVPATWAKDYTSPAWRHLEGANYAFADGHVKFYPSQRAPGILLTKEGVPTFSPR